MIEILHFRDSDKILNDKNMMKDVQTTLEYLADVLTGVQFKGELSGVLVGVAQYIDSVFQPGLTGPGIGLHRCGEIHLIQPCDDLGLDLIQVGEH